MDEEVNPLERDHSLSVVLPGGLEKNAIVHGSKPVMDLLVTLCASYHLNPSDYTVEVLSPNKNNISFKPNSPIGSLEVDKIVLKPKGVEENPRRPYMPEATVRLLINYNKSHKAVVRVNPRIPLEFLMPQVCEKCEFNVETTILLTYSNSKEPLDLTKTLNDYGLREVFAKDTARKERQQRPSVSESAADTPTKVISPPPVEALPKEKKTNRGFLSLFRREKKKSEMDRAVSSKTYPDLNKQTSGSLNPLSGPSSNSLPAEMPKKRRAPQPPIGASQSVPNSLGTCHLRTPQRSADSTLRSTKRRAPLPPSANSYQQLQVDTEVKVTVQPLNALKELSECDESDSVNLSLSSSSSSSPHPSHPQSSSSFSHPSLAHLHQVADSYLPTIRGKDLSDARCALAKVLTSSLSGGTLVKRLKNSASLPKMYHGSSFRSVTEWCPENEVVRTEFVSGLKSGLYTEHEWEDPVERKRLTTFKVVPVKTNMSHILEIPLDVPEQYQISAGDTPEIHQCSPETKDACFPDKSVTEIHFLNPDPCSLETQASESSPPPLELDNQRCSPLSQVEDVVEAPKEVSKVGDIGETSKEEYEVGSVPEPQEEKYEVGDVETPKEKEEPVEEADVAPDSPSGQSHREITSELNPEDHKIPRSHSESTDKDKRNTSGDEEKVEEELAQKEEESFPPPPPPVFFTEDQIRSEIMEEVREISSTSSPPSPQLSSPFSNGKINASGEDPQSEPSSDLPDETCSRPKPLGKMSAGPSRFAQAVALAVQKSRLLGHGKALGPQVPSDPHGTVPSAPRSTYQYGA